ncbi:MAG TPA: prenyltransferase/squalene oxidase repeat-containing protein, partial [Planctomycetota bacterium]|nr:prenyltransferase/squalene oxidase repeat-containing protein [Planctomycetota bacterium]
MSRNVRALRLALPAALAAFAAGAAALRGTATAVDRAAGFLAGLQGADGGWHSSTYGLLSSGQSLTPLVLGALLDLPRGDAKRAFDFVVSQLDAGGVLGHADPMLDDYPTYATALALEAAARRGDDALVARLAKGLRAMQLGEAHGWTPAESAYGAWGMGRAVKPPHSGHVDLSMTRHALEALAAAGAKRGDPAFERALRFVESCRAKDGGFYFSSVVVDANKAGKDREGYRSYGTATADGILSLLAMGFDPSDARVQSAANWLVAHHRTDVAPGFPPGEPERWADAMVHYYLAASAEVFRRLDVREAPAGHDWRAELERALASRQRPDGSWRADSVLGKEDDPLIATALALRALEAAR